MINTVVYLAENGGRKSLVSVGMNEASSVKIKKLTNELSEKLRELVKEYNKKLQNIS